MLTTACTNNDNYIVETLNNSLNEEIDLNNMVRVNYPPQELVIYESLKDNTIYIFIFQDNKHLETTSYKPNDIHNEGYLWNYIENEDNNMYVLVGGVSKKMNPQLMINEKEFTGNIISLDDAYIFFSFYDNPLSKPVKVELSK